MSQVFGVFIEKFSPDRESLELRFTLGSRSLKEGWRNNRLTAYFIADYISTFLPKERIDEGKNAVSYVGNELLENAMKFHEGSKDDKVEFGIHFMEDTEKVTAAIFTKNNVTAQKAEEFQTFIKEILSGDPNELYIQQIEKTAEDKDSEASGLGLLTALNDYTAKLGWKFESALDNPQIIAVTTMAQIVV